MAYNQSTGFSKDPIFATMDPAPVYTQNVAQTAPQEQHIIDLHGQSFVAPSISPFQLAPDLHAQQGQNNIFLDTEWYQGTPRQLVLPIPQHTPVEMIPSIATSSVIVPNIYNNAMNLEQPQQSSMERPVFPRSTISINTASGYVEHKRPYGKCSAATSSSPTANFQPPVQDQPFPSLWTLFLSIYKQQQTIPRWSNLVLFIYTMKMTIALPELTERESLMRRLPILYSALTKLPDGNSMGKLNIDDLLVTITSLGAENNLMHQLVDMIQYADNYFGIDNIQRANFNKAVNEIAQKRKISTGSKDNDPSFIKLASEMFCWALGMASFNKTVPLPKPNKYYQLNYHIHVANCLKNANIDTNNWLDIYFAYGRAIDQCYQERSAKRKDMIKEIASRLEYSQGEALDRQNWAYAYVMLTQEDIQEELERLRMFQDGKLLKQLEVHGSNSSFGSTKLGLEEKGQPTWSYDSGTQLNFGLAEV
jgi:hypothetical protein